MVPMAITNAEVEEDLSSSVLFNRHALLLYNQAKSFPFLCFACLEGVLHWTISCNVLFIICVRSGACAVVSVSSWREIKSRHVREFHDYFNTFFSFKNPHQSDWFWFFRLHRSNLLFFSDLGSTGNPLIKKNFAPCSCLLGVPKNVFGQIWELNFKEKITFYWFVEKYQTKPRSWHNIWTQG